MQDINLTTRDMSSKYGLHWNFLLLAAIKVTGKGRGEGKQLSLLSIFQTSICYRAGDNRSELDTGLSRMHSVGLTVRTKFLMMDKRGLALKTGEGLADLCGHALM